MKIPVYAILWLLIFSFSCAKKQSESTEEANAKDEKGLVGYVDLSEQLEQDLVDQGARIFTEKCSSCHTIDTVNFFVPSFAGVTNRRSPEWIMNMILHSEKMVRADSTALALLKKHRKIMPDPELTVDQARAVLEFFRYNDEEQVGNRDQAATDR